MSLSTSTKWYGQSWKQEALLFILLISAVLGSPVVHSPDSSYTFISAQSQPLDEHKLTPLEEDVFGYNLDERTGRKKRFLGDALKKAKQAKLLAIGVASGNAAKKLTKSAVKSIISFGIKALIFNFLFKKISQVLEFKTRALANKNRPQNSVSGDPGSSNLPDSSASEIPGEQIPEFNADKVALQVPDAVFGPTFNIANGASQVLGTLIQNTAQRIAKLVDSLKPLLKSSTSFKSKKRETDLGLDDFIDDSQSTNNFQKEMEKSSVKSGYEVLTQRR